MNGEDHAANIILEYNDGDIILVGLQTAADVAKQELLKRGFLIKCTSIDGQNNTNMSLVIGPKLLQQTAVGLGYGYVEKEKTEEPRQTIVGSGDGSGYYPKIPYQPQQRVRIAMQALTILEQMKKKSVIVFCDARLKHKNKELKELADNVTMFGSKTSDKYFVGLDIAGINNYFGSQVALYFGWAQFYNASLVIPAALGVVLVFWQTVTGTLDCAMVPLFTMAIALWGTFFLEFWKREQNKYAFEWGVLGQENEELQKELVKDIGLPRRTNQLMYLVTVPMNVVVVYGVFRSMLYFIWLSDNATEVYGKNTFRSYIPTILYSVVPIIFKMLYQYLAIILTNIEQHPTKTEANQHFLTKMFAFMFINSYCALFYIAFWLRDLNRLHGLLMSMFVTKAIIYKIMRYYEKEIANLTERVKKPVMEVLEKMFKKMRKFVEEFVFGKKKTCSHPQKKGTEEELGSEQKSQEEVPLIQKGDQPKTEEHTPEQIEDQNLLNEILKEEYSPDMDYLELVLQFGYVTMFAVAFPQAPLLALCNNWFELRMDFRDLTEKCRRPLIQNRSNIGYWYTALDLVSLASVLTNCGLMVMVSTHADFFIPSSLRDTLDTYLGRIFVALMLEHLLIGVKVILAAVIEDESPEVTQALQEKENKQHEVNVQAHQALRRVQKAAVTELDDVQLLRAQAMANLASRYRSAWSFDPIYYFPLLVLPFLINSLKLSLYWIYLLGFMYIAFLQRMKDNADAKAANGIISDANVMSIVKKEMPGWFLDSEVSRMDWYNKMMVQLWSHISEYVNTKVDAQVQHYAQKYKPKRANKDYIQSKLSLGTIPPKITGIKVYETEESSLRMDVECKWAGDTVYTAKLLTQLGNPKTLLEVDNIHFLGKFRLEFAPLIFTEKSVIPFGGVSFSFLADPHVDFALKLLNFDVMPFGIGDLSLAGAVASGVKYGCASYMYPGKYAYALQTPEDIEKAFLGTSESATGILRVRVKSAKDLVASDFDFGKGKSDPFVVLTIGADSHKTKTMKKNLDPVWEDAVFDFIVREKTSPGTNEVSIPDLDIKVYDEDDWNQFELLGSATQNIITAFDPEVQHSIEVKLDQPEKYKKEKSLNYDKQSLLFLDVIYMPLKKVGFKVEVDADVLYARDGLRSSDIENDDWFQDLNTEPANKETAEDKAKDAEQEKIKPKDRQMEEKPKKAPQDDHKPGFFHFGGKSSPKVTNATEQEPSPLPAVKQELSWQMERQSSIADFEVMSGETYKISLGCLTVSSIYCFHLIDAKDQKKFNPYVKIQLGDQVLKTKPEPNESEPVYHDAKSFIIEKPVTASLLVEIKDDTALAENIVLGTVLIKIKDVLKSNGKLDRDFCIEGDKLGQSAKIHMCLDLKTCSGTVPKK